MTARPLRRLLLIGLLTAAPLVVTWLVLDFLFAQLSRAGAPWLLALSRALRTPLPGVADWLLESQAQSLMAAAITLLLLIVLGWFSSRVLGQRIIAWAETLVGRVPLVAAIYGGTKRFLATVKERPAGAQRVVLINFPSPEMKTIGFVTRVMNDADTGEELAIVYVPTAPNPTSGYIEIVPLASVTQTDWSVDEAMAFVMTAGATGSGDLTFRGRGSPPRE